MITLTPTAAAEAALPWEVDRWLNAEATLSLASLRGRVVALEAFQMLCPGAGRTGSP